ncbi:MAG: YbhQ family protein [Candidatus Dasytiphilus stammeri]
MKLSNRIHIITGQKCEYIIINLIWITAFILGWKYHALVHISSVFVIFYNIIFMALLILQRHSHWRQFLELLDDLTTAYYCEAVIITIFLLSRMIGDHLLLIFLVVLILAVPARFYLILKRK